MKRMAVRALSTRTLQEPARRLARVLRRLSGFLENSSSFPPGPVSGAADPGQQAFIVELVGPSGVGKSTFARELMRDVGMSRVASARGRVSLDRPQLRQGIGRATSSHQAAYGNLLHESVARVLERELDLVAKLHLIDFLVGNLREDALVTRCGGNFLRSDGLLANFRSAILRSFGTDEAGLRSLLSCRAAIACRAPAQVVVERVLERRRTGAYRPQFYGNSRSAVENRVEVAIQQHTEYVAFLRSVGVPVVEVNLASDRETAKRHAHDLMLSFFPTSSSSPRP